MLCAEFFFNKPHSMIGAYLIHPAIACLLAFVFCLGLTPLVRRLGLVDEPGNRKVHETPTPLSGGIGIYLAFFLVAWATLPHDRFLVALLIGGLFMLVVGLLDDRYALPPLVRFPLQVVACLVVVYGADVRLEDFGHLFYDNPLSLGALAVPVTLFAALGVINAFNMIDGMDGLSGSIFLVAAGGMAFLALQGGAHAMFSLLMIAMGSVGGFLLLNARWPWNRRARVFLGDGGSTLLGFVLAWSFIALGNDRPYLAPRVFMPMTAVWLIAVPLLDTSTLIWRRWRSGQSAFEADQHHLHHAFLRAGFTVRQAWLGITLLALVLGGIGVGLELLGVPDYVSFWGFILVAFGYYFYLRNGWNRGRFLGRGFSH